MRWITNHDLSNLPVSKCFYLLPVLVLGCLFLAYFLLRYVSFFFLSLSFLSNDASSMEFISRSPGYIPDTHDGSSRHKDGIGHVGLVTKKAGLDGTRIGDVGRRLVIGQMATLLLFLAAALVEVGGYLEEEERSSFGRQRKRPSLFDYERGGVSVQRCKGCVSDVKFFVSRIGVASVSGWKTRKRSTDSWLIPSEVTKVCFSFKFFNILLALIVYSPHCATAMSLFLDE